MWVAKIEFNEKGTLIGEKAIKYNVNIFAFPISYSYEPNWIIVHIAGTIIGEQNNIKKFFKELKKDKRVLELEIKKDFFIGAIKEPLFSKSAYNKEIIYISPAFISNEGLEIINIGSFNKKSLIEIIDTLEKKREGKLISIQKKKVGSISLMKIHPELTEKQKNAIQIAIKNGYYHSPRKIDLKQLSKIAGLSFSTYQVHLRKAEEKLIPFFFE